MHRKHEISGASIENEKNKRIRCLGSVKLVDTGIENKKNKRIRCLGSVKLVDTGIENRKNKSFRCIGSVKLMATGIENKKNKRIRCIGSMKLMVRASGIRKTRISDAIVFAIGNRVKSFRIIFRMWRRNCMGTCVHHRFPGG